jgi:hypothetical protein
MQESTHSPTNADALTLACNNDDVETCSARLNRTFAALRLFVSAAFVLRSQELVLAGAATQSTPLSLQYLHALGSSLLSHCFICQS